MTSKSHVEANELRNTKFCSTLLLIVLLTVSFSLSLGVSLLTNSVVLSNSGNILTSNGVTAKSGSAKDIQAAVDLVAASPSGTGKVYIPAGTFNFVNVGEPWITVNIPAGINLFGAPNQKSVNGSNVSWNTVLVQTWDVPSSETVGVKSWFKITGNNDPAKPSRLSDIKLVGYRDVYPNTQYYLMAVWVSGVVDFRIDHNYFRNAGAGIQITSGPDDSAHKNLPVRGVIDHNTLLNTGGDPGVASYAQRTLDYGVGVYGNSWNDFWDPNIYNVLGHYTDYSVYIENNYMSRWRHDVSSINGMHYVFRFNTIEDDNGFGTLDGHGTYSFLGTRAMEIYNNTFLDPNYEYETSPYVVGWRGGGGVFFNNTIRDYASIIYFNNEGTVSKTYPGSPDCPVYIWNNNYLPGGIHYDQPSYIHQPWTGVYDTRMPNYIPYPYPHPLTLQP